MTTLSGRLEDARRDLRDAGRTLSRSPGFAAAVVLLLALGIGANTAIFTLIDVVLLRPLPVEAPERLVVLDAINQRGSQTNLSYPLFERLRGGNAVFSGMFAALDGTNQIEIAGTEPGSRPEPVALQLVSGEYFDVLGARPFAGRVLSARDDRAGADAVVVLSHRFWQRRFGGDRTAIGRTVRLKHVLVTIVGVARPELFGTEVGTAPDVWAPLTMEPALQGEQSLLARPNVGWLRVMARLRPDRTMTEAAAALVPVMNALRAEPTPLGRFAARLARIEPSDGSQGFSRFRERFSQPLRILASLVAVVLLIVCANVASLLLARATARRREVAVRLAVGASRGRLVRQFLTESVLLAGAGGALGLLLAWWGSRVLLTMASGESLPIPIDVAPNVRTLAFTLLVSMATVIVSGLTPALIASRMDVSASFALAAGARARARSSPLAVVAQVALSVVLLTGAGLFARTLSNLRTLDPGFDADGLLQVQLSSSSDRVVEALRAAPGVRSVAVALGAGFGTGMPKTCCIAVEGYAHYPAEDRLVRTAAAGDGFFRTTGVRLLSGREFSARENADAVPGRTAPTVAIVNDAFARRYFAGASPLGRRIGWGDPPNVKYGIEVVGVAENAIYEDLRQAAMPLIYFPAASGALLTIRAVGDPAALIDTVRRTIRAQDDRLEIAHLGIVSEEIERALVREKLLAKLSGFFGGLAAIVVAFGVYALAAGAVAGRVHEIGIRMAIGAQRTSVLWMEMRAALRLVAAGVAVGVPAALAGGDLVARHLFGVSSADTAVLAGASVLVAAVSALAAFMPARRASRIDPVIALRAG